MSHIVQIQTQVRDPAAIAAACRRLQLSEPVYGSSELFSGTATGWAVALPGWHYPVVFDTAAAQAHFDHYEGRWGDPGQLNRFLQTYAVCLAQQEARKRGHRVSEQQLVDGSIRLTIHLEGGAT